jgi:co-chaperonin GroES (HSP10)
MSIQPTGTHSASLNHDSNTDIPANANIRPLRDQIIVEPLNVVLSQHIIVHEDLKPVRGIIKAVGPGHYPMKYDHEDKAKRTQMWKADVFQPTTVKVGDVIELGGVEFQGYKFPTVYWGGKLHLICREADVSGVLDGMTEEQARAESRALTF